MKGSISLQRQVDREEIEKFILMVVAADGGRNPHAATATATISIADANDNRPSCEEVSCKVSSIVSFPSLNSFCNLVALHVEYVNKPNRFKMHCICFCAFRH